MFRHPDLFNLHKDCCRGLKSCGAHGGTFSRDHTLSLINYTMYSGDKLPLRKFFWFTIRHFGQHSGGEFGQRMQNVNTYAAMMLVLGGWYYLLGLLLSLLTIPALHFAAKKLEVGYRIILATEFAWVYYLNYPKLLCPLLRCIPQMCYKRQPSNLYYEVITAIIDGRDPTYLTPLATKLIWEQQLYGTDDSWYFTNPDDGRKGTGVDGQYILALINTYKCGRG
jgi:hypothetical protein